MSSLPFKVKAVFDYASPHADDLSFPNGQIISVTEEEDEDWYVGEYIDASGDKQSGLFPRNFVEKYEPSVPSRPTRATRPKAADAPPAVLQEEAPSAPVLSRPEPLSPPATHHQSVVEEDSEVVPAVREPIAPVIQAQPPATSRPAEPKPAPAAPAAKGPPPAVSEKPSSFKDRIAAFNNSKAAPVTPFKPTGPPIKKPFVAPPPSRNAYIPPPRAEPVQRTYRREEDPEIAERQAEDQTAAENAGLSAAHSSTMGGAGAPETEADEDAPKPTSLKDRIALLQKQQVEQANRRADGAQKEKPKKPVKRRTESFETLPTADAEGAELEPNLSGEADERASIDRPRERVRAPPARRPSIPNTPSLAAPQELDIMSDANDADQSAAGETTEDNDTEVDEADERHLPAAPMHVAPAQALPKREADAGEGNDNTEGEDEEEDEVDVETRRKLELRERMAKMSGGMGMAGMFGPPGGMSMPSSAPQKRQSVRETQRPTEQEQNTLSASPPQQRLPTMPMPAMQQTTSPSLERHQAALAVEHEEESEALITGQRGPKAVPDLEDLKPDSAAATQSTERDVPPSMPRDRPVPAPPPASRGVPPSAPSERPVPKPPAPESRAAPPLPPLRMPDADSVPDDGLFAIPRQSTGDFGSEASLPSRPAPPPAPASHPLPPRPDGRSPPTAAAKRASYFGSDAPPTSPSDKRASRMPPIPGSFSPASPSVRSPPPPPPPTAAPMTPAGRSGQPDDAGSEYEGDYDTDIASGVSHKEALKAHVKESSVDPTSPPDIPTRSPGQPPATPQTHRAVPPPPPSQTPKTRASVDSPRAPPPPVPPPRDERGLDEEEAEFGNFTRYDRVMSGGLGPATVSAHPPVPSRFVDEPDTQDQDSSDDLYEASLPSKTMDRGPPVPPQAAPYATPQASQAPPPATRVPTMPPRQSVEASRGMVRQSTDISRPGNDGHIATDVDLAERTLWWSQKDQPPPIFQKRSDLLCEIEESSTSKRGGKTTISKDVYILFLDYSQTVITVRYDSRDPADASLEQRHEPPPARLRQDQLETYWQRFGARMAEAANNTRDKVVGDGAPGTLVLDLMRPLKDALLPIGTRAYGALVYANLANASVQQFDEIRPGDVMTLRNARFQGKHGTMHQKYAMDVQGHVAVVVDWDGTKKKVRAWEQGREKSKVRLESFRLGDLKSGEVRVWRVVGRSWVGWDSESGAA